MSKYNFETREKAIALSDEIGTKKAAEQLNISVGTLAYWRMLRKRAEEKKLSGIKTEFNPQKEIADNPYVTFEAKPKENRVFLRGEIYYVSRGATTGCEMATGRPAIIVSNDGINKNLSTVEVVYLTTKPKPLWDEYVRVRSSGVLSTAICDQISTVDKSRIKEKIGNCTHEEMERIDLAILHSLGLNKYSVAYASSDKVMARVSSIVAERDAYKEMCGRLMQK